MCVIELKTYPRPTIFLLDVGVVFASDEGSASIGVVVFVAEGLGFVVQL
jgi:hypothetical protein